MRALISLLVLLSTMASARAEDIRLGLSSEIVAITSSFSGTNIAVFGTIEGGRADVLQRGGYDVVVAIEGPPVNVVVRRKQRRFGIWINGAGQPFNAVPSFYSAAFTRPLAEISDAASMRMLRIGFQNMPFKPISSDGGETNPDDPSVYAASLIRLRRDNGLFVESADGVQFLSPTLFRARLRLPANVPIGVHRARAFLFRDGKFLHTRSTLLKIEKSGFEQATYNLAHRNGLLYGILAVLIAIATGWAASVIFRKD